MNIHSYILQNYDQIISHNIKIVIIHVSMYVCTYATSCYRIEGPAPRHDGSIIAPCSRNNDPDLYELYNMYLYTYVFGWSL